MADLDRTIFEQAGVAPTTGPTTGDLGEAVAPPPGVVSPMGDTIQRIAEFMMRPCGPGGPDDYKSHALNWAPWSDGLARFFWGLTGLVGSDLNLGIVACVTGLIQYAGEVRNRG